MVGRRDHRRPHERHVDGRDRDPVLEDLGARSSARRRRARPSRRRRRRSAGTFVCTPIVETLTIWPELALAHPRQQLQDQLHRPEVVELDRPLEVVDALVRERDRAPDRAPGVVDEDVDAAVLGDHLVADARDLLELREVGRVDVRRRRRLPGSRRRPARASPRVRATSRTIAAGLPDLQRQRLADPRRGAGDQDALAADTAFSSVRRSSGFGIGRFPGTPRATLATAAARFLSDGPSSATRAA